MNPKKTYPITVEILLADNEGYIFQVIGSTGDIYIVGYDYNDGWFCPCPDYHFRKHTCKHIAACKALLDMQQVNVSEGLFCEVTA